MVMAFGSFASRVVATKVVATDGTGDFTDIQAAIDDLPSGGGVVYIKEGTYTITAKITISSSNVTIIGAGMSTIINTTSNITLISISSGNNTIIKDIYLKGNNTGSSQNGISFTTSSNIQVIGCRIEDMGNSGIVFVGAGTEARILNNYIIDCANTAINSNGLRTLISNNHLIDCTGGGIVVNQNHCSIINNILLNISGIGIASAASDFNIISGNNIQNTDNNAINIGTSDDCVVSGNIIEDSGDSASEHGINISTSNRCCISGNLVRTVSGIGIYIVDSGSNDCLVVSNLVSNTTGAAITDSGTSTLVANNETP